MRIAARGLCPLGLTLAALLCPLDAGLVAAADRATEDAVLEAAFRQQIEEHLDATERARRTVVCLAIDPGGAPQSPSREFMARLAGRALGAARRRV